MSKAKQVPVAPSEAHPSVTPAADFADIPSVVDGLNPGEPHPADPIEVPVAPLPPVDRAEAARPPQPAPEMPSRAFVGFVPGV